MEYQFLTSQRKRRSCRDPQKAQELAGATADTGVADVFMAALEENVCGTRGQGEEVSYDGVPVMNSTEFQ